jgi:nitrate/nitrite transporter NarK
VGAAGGLGGFFPPLVMALVKSLWGSYLVGFLLLAAVAAACMLVLARIAANPAPPPRSPPRDAPVARQPVGAR